MKMGITAVCQHLLMSIKTSHRPEVAAAVTSAFWNVRRTMSEEEKSFSQIHGKEILQFFFRFIHYIFILILSEKKKDFERPRRFL